MTIDLKLKDMWYWTANFAMMGAAFLSMYLNNGLPFVAVTIPLVLLDRAYAVPLLLFIAAIEGSFKTLDSGNQSTETMAIMLMMPLFIYDYIKNNSVKVPYKFSMLFLLFGLLVIMGMFTWNSHPEIKRFVVGLVGKMAIQGIRFKMIMKVFKIIFFFIYLKVLINKDKELLYRALTLLKDMVPYLTILVMLNMMMFGYQSDATHFDTLHFGEANHGDFSANMNAMGIFLYIGVFEPKSNWFKRMVSLGAIGALLFIIMNLASRNGLLTFCLLGVFGAIVGLWNRNWGFKVVMVTAAIFAAGAAAYLFKDSPTVQRFIYQTEVEGGGDRLDYWSAGISALHEEPVLGLGGDETSAIYAVGKYSPDVPDHVMHNTFIEALVEYGIVGEVFFLTFVLTILWHGFKNLKLGLSINNMLLCAPTVSYFISIFAGCFISRIWETTLWYHMTLVFAVYILYIMPVEVAAKRRKTYLLHGLPDPLENPSLAIPYSL
jgi:O-antigen ligase